METGQAGVSGIRAGKVVAIRYDGLMASFPKGYCQEQISVSLSHAMTRSSGWQQWLCIHPDGHDVSETRLVVVNVCCSVPQPSERSRTRADPRVKKLFEHSSFVSGLHERVKSISLTPKPVTRMVTGRFSIQVLLSSRCLFRSQADSVLAASVATTGTCISGVKIAAISHGKKIVSSLGPFSRHSGPQEAIIEQWSSVKEHLTASVGLAA